MAKIFIIDDELLNCQCEQMLLKRAGYDVIYEIDADKAIGVYEREKPELLLIDINLGEGKKTGIDILREIRVHDKKTKALVMSGMAMTEGYEKEAMELGAGGFIPKPVQLDKLVSKIKELIG